MDHKNTTIMSLLKKILDHGCEQYFTAVSSKCKLCSSIWFEAILDVSNNVKKIQEKMIELNIKETEFSGVNIIIVFLCENILKFLTKKHSNKTGCLEELIEIKKTINILKSCSPSKELKILSKMMNNILYSDMIFDSDSKIVKDVLDSLEKYLKSLISDGEKFEILKCKEREKPAEFVKILNSMAVKWLKNGAKEVLNYSKENKDETTQMPQILPEPPKKYETRQKRISDLNESKIIEISRNEKSENFSFEENSQTKINANFWKIDDETIDEIFRIYTEDRKTGILKNKHNTWSLQELAALKEGIKKFGAEWKQILQSFPFKNRTVTNLRRKFYCVRTKNRRSKQLFNKAYKKFVQEGIS